MTMTRLYVSRMKSDVKQLASRCSNLKTVQEESNRKLEENEQELAASQLLIQQVNIFKLTKNTSDPKTDFNSNKAMTFLNDFLATKKLVFLH